MNKLTKVGLSALCGSLAAVSSAHAGEMTVTGGVDMSWISYEDDTTGNPIGMGSNLTFTGAGELDNGWTFGITIAMLNNDAYSTTAINIGMGGLGTLNLNQGDSGNGIDALDDKMPTAWEEAWGAGLGTGIQLVSGVGPQSNIQYTTPTIGGITLALATAPDIGAADSNDKATSGQTADNTGAGYDATININPSFGTEILSGLDLFVGGHIGERYVDSTPGNDRYEAVGGLTYSLGPVAIGYARSGIDTGKNTTATDNAWYKNSMFGISFNVNDNLSVSYADHVGETGLVTSKVSTGVVEIESFQVAYTMGGASVRYANIESSNSAYQYGTEHDKEANVISVALAF